MNILVVEISRLATGEDYKARVFGLSCSFFTPRIVTSGLNYIKKTEILVAVSEISFKECRIKYNVLQGYRL